MGVRAWPCAGLVLLVRVVPCVSVDRKWGASRRLGVSGGVLDGGLGAGPVAWVGGGRRVSHDLEDAGDEGWDRRVGCVRKGAMPYLEIEHPDWDELAGVT
jgi:hypothetical protein